MQPNVKPSSQYFFFRFVVLMEVQLFAACNPHLELGFPLWAGGESTLKGPAPTVDDSGLPTLV